MKIAQSGHIVITNTCEKIHRFLFTKEKAMIKKLTCIIVNESIALHLHIPDRELQLDIHESNRILFHTHTFLTIYLARIVLILSHLD